MRGTSDEVAAHLLRALWDERAGILSTQVLQEFYVNATRKIRKPLSKPEARSVVDTYAPWCVEGITTGDIIAGFQIEDQARIGFWDALILAVAARSGARRVVSEDLNNGQSIAGISIHNPFKGLSRSRDVEHPARAQRLTPKLEAELHAELKSFESTR